MKIVHEVVDFHPLDRADPGAVHPRHQVPRLVASLKEIPAVLLAGGRQTGKTTLARALVEDRPGARYLTGRSGGAIRRPFDPAACTLSGRVACARSLAGYRIEQRIPIAEVAGSDRAGCADVRPQGKATCGGVAGCGIAARAGQVPRMCQLGDADRGTAEAHQPGTRDATADRSGTVLLLLDPGHSVPKANLN